MTGLSADEEAGIEAALESYRQGRVVDAKRARQIGLSLALIFRIILLFALTWLMGLTKPLVTVLDMGISWRDIILIGGGLFLIAKATHEIHAEV